MYYGSTKAEQRLEFEDKCAGFLWGLVSSRDLLPQLQDAALFKQEFVDLAASKDLPPLSLPDEVAVFHVNLNLRLLLCALLQEHTEVAQAWQKWQQFWAPDRVSLPARLEWANTSDRSIVLILSMYSDVFRLLCRFETQNILKLMHPILQTMVRLFVIM